MSTQICCHDFISNENSLDFHQNVEKLIEKQYFDISLLMHSDILSIITFKHPKEFYEVQVNYVLKKV